MSALWLSNRAAGAKVEGGIAVLLSVLIPGGGQLYKVDVISGILWLLFTSLFYGLLLPAGFILHMSSVVVAAMGDPTR